MLPEELKKVYQDILTELNRKIITCFMGTLMTKEPFEDVVKMVGGDKIKIRSYFNHRFNIKIDVVLKSKLDLHENLGKYIKEITE